eukprot:scaffold7525_cov248-Pinguiococcus_pyrenoidosus.AAC.4
MMLSYLDTPSHACDSPAPRRPAPWSCTDWQPHQCQTCQARRRVTASWHWGAWNSSAAEAPSPQTATDGPGRFPVSIVDIETGVGTESQWALATAGLGVLLELPRVRNPLLSPRLRRWCRVQPWQGPGWPRYPSHWAGCAPASRRRRRCARPETARWRLDASPVAEEDCTGPLTLPEGPGAPERPPHGESGLGKAVSAPTRRRLAGQLTCCAPCCRRTRRCPACSVPAWKLSIAEAQIASSANPQTT